MSKDYRVITVAGGARLTRRLALVLALTALTGVREAQANLVLNGGFESGTFASWSLSGGPTFCPPLVAAAGSSICAVALALPPHSGTYSAVLGNNATDWFLDQVLTTSPGGTYALTFWLANVDVGSGIIPNDFHVSWNGTEIYSATDLGVSAFSQLTFGGLPATGGSTLLRIGGFRQDPGYFLLDDVSVEPVPEPASWLLLGAGLIALRGSLMRRRR